MIAFLVHLLNGNEANCGVGSMDIGTAAVRLDRVVVWLNRLRMTMR